MVDTFAIGWGDGVFAATPLCATGSCEAWKRNQYRGRDRTAWKRCVEKASPSNADALEERAVAVCNEDQALLVPPDAIHCGLADEGWLGGVHCRT